MLKPMKPRQSRVAHALLNAPAWIAREAIDRIAGASNGPEVICQLRNRLGYDALSMALHYLSQPNVNVASARRKAIQALSALRGLDLSLEG